MTAFDDVDDVVARLSAVDYLVDEATATTVFLADRLEKPILAEGPPGTGKTQLAKALAGATDRTLIRLQCYEGLDESKVLYEWDYKKQLLRIQAGGESWDQVHDDLFGEEFLLTRPLLAAIRSERPVVLLIDEVDRVELETEALLLELLSDFQVSIPELGTLSARHVPLVVLTSNNTRDLSEALKRRCFYLYVGYPDIQRETEIIRRQVPGIEDALAERVSEVVAGIRGLDLQKAPSVAETLDWARALVCQAVSEVQDAEVSSALPVLLKHQSDIEVVRAKLRPEV